MLVSTKGRYALRVMVDLAEHQAAGRIRSKRSRAPGDFEKYLENILATLVRANMLSGMRGKGGGYVLTRPPEQYTVGEILRLTEGSLAPVACLDGDCKGCSRSDECPTLDVWKNLDKLINDYLDGVTLDQLVAPNEGYDYVI
ncbi:MAG: RrF2 family transcriptional regulator [Collinsella sp.]